jgi:YesN/AraC family two-component response regulator
MRKEEISLDNRFGEQYAGRYVFQEITWAKRSRIIQKWTKYHHITGQVIRSDFVAIQTETIIASLREQPAHKPITLEKLLGEEDGVPIELGELFSRIANKLCGITPDEQRFLSEQSKEANHTQHSQTSDSQKSSVGPHSKSEDNQPKQSSNSSLS